MGAGPHVDAQALNECEGVHGSVKTSHAADVEPLQRLD